jgi:hypothetical protein
MMIFPPAVTIPCVSLACDGRNYVVQHVIEHVPGAPWAKDSLHLAFRNQYVSLSRQKAGSHVVQRCLQFFSRKQAEEIVFELLTCKPQCDLGELISDPFANYVLQTAMEHAEVRIPPLLQRRERLIADVSG